MFEYFRSDTNESVGLAYSFMRCRDTKLGHKHGPHIHNLPETNLGPYVCNGRPGVDLYDMPKKAEKKFVTTEFGVVEDKTKGTEAADEVFPRRNPRWWQR